MNDVELTRIVRMHFTKDGLELFLTVFHSNKQSIRNFDGCTHLELLKDSKDPLLYTTLSHWKNAESLERYRQSDLFISVWSRVKPLFSKNPEAFSLIRFLAL
jgi:heme oxygenase (mycobilin-producing)